MDKDFIRDGLTKIINIDDKKGLIKVQKLIYTETKLFLIDHEEEINFEKKINLKFKKIPTKSEWSRIMSKVNNSIELRDFINSDSIKNAFKIIFKNPRPFSISTFRARFPNQNRVIYNWHQDEGTWFLSKNKIHLNKFPATLWFSINGANIEDSIELIKFSHLQKLFYHEFVNGQGYFNIKDELKIDSKNLIKLKIKPSQCVIFHPLLIHRSAPSNHISLRPRYTIDIRYYDKKYNPKYKIDFKFRIARLLGGLN